jgi:hypothetical protein
MGERGEGGEGRYALFSCVGCVAHILCCVLSSASARRLAAPSFPKRSTAPTLDR